MPRDHFYCLDFYGEAASSLGYEREGIAGYAFKSPRNNTVPIHRYFHPGTGDHFYTQDSSVPAGYKDEGIEWYIFKTQEAGTVAFNRWYNRGTGDHFYTTDITGELATQGGYVSEGNIGFLYTRQASGSQPVYRWYQTGLMSKFTFSGAITAEQKKKLYERHSWAYFRAGLTDQLTGGEQDRVRDIYKNQAIHHDITNVPNVNGSAILGGRQLWINFEVLFPQGDNEIAQTLLHEMMHCVGYAHPAKSGTPGDGGLYFNSTPLRAELAIAGVQSDVVAEEMAEGGMKPDASLANLRKDDRPGCGVKA
jgi:hypothetical protein